MENKKTYKGKFYYSCSTEADGWGRKISFTGFATIDPWPTELDEVAKGAATKAFDKMIAECGEFACTLLEPGATDSKAFTFEA